MLRQELWTALAEAPLEARTIARKEDPEGEALSHCASGYVELSELRPRGVRLWYLTTLSLMEHGL